MARILVVEDRSTLRSLYQIVLSRLEHEVTSAPTGEARELRDAGILPTAPLIVATATSYVEAQAVSRPLGACAVLVKPFDISSPLAAVQEALSASTL